MTQEILLLGNVQSDLQYCVNAGVLGPRVTRLSLCVYGIYGGSSSECTLPDLGRSMPALRSLCLRGYVQDIETHALEHMSCLSELTLGGEEWSATALHQWVFHLPTSLDVLSVQSINPKMEGHSRPIFCPVTPCVTSLKNLRHLEFLRVSNLRPSEWKDPLWFPFTSLSKLELKGCRLQAIPACVISLSALEYLDVSHNPLRVLPKGPYLSGLQSLVARHCDMTVFPLKAISLATSLQTLNLNGNNLAWTEKAREVVKNIAEVHVRSRHWDMECQWDWELP